MKVNTLHDSSGTIYVLNKTKNVILNIFNMTAIIDGLKKLIKYT